MTENVVSRSAEFGTGRIVVMIGALDPHPIRQVSVPSLMIESVPRGSWQDDTAVTRFLDHAGGHLVPRLQDQRELPLQQNTLKPFFAKIIKRDKKIQLKTCILLLLSFYTCNSLYLINLNHRNIALFFSKIII